LNVWDLAVHERPHATELHNRTGDEITLGEEEKISI
jgi:hypothetical protein